MGNTSKIKKVFKSKPTIEGAGVHLRRAFGFSKNYFDIECDPFAGNGSLVLFNKGDEIVAVTEKDPVRFLLISGKPIGEPVAWYGPIVMNTQEELRIAFEEYNNGTFIKHIK